MLGLCTNVHSDNSINCHCLTLRLFSVVAFCSFISSHLLLPLLFPFHLLHRHLLLIVLLLLFLDPCVWNSVILLTSHFFYILITVSCNGTTWYPILLRYLQLLSDPDLSLWLLMSKLHFSSFSCSLLFSVTLCDPLERINLNCCVIQFWDTLLVTYF
jgi:hypothetical protein